MYLTLVTLKLTIKVKTLSGIWLSLYLCYII